MENQALYQILEDRRREMGLTQGQVGQLVTGRPDTSTLQNIRRGSSPSIDRVAAMCEALGLELYVGPKRDVPRPRGDMRLGAQDFSLVARYDVNVSAGPGLIPASEAEGERLAFSRTWLLRQGINPEMSGLVTARGDSMAPTVPDGALVLVHCQEAQVDRDGIYAFSRGGGAFVKRLVVAARALDGRPTSMVVISDNPEYPPEVIAGRGLNDLRIVGRVRCVTVDLP